MPSTAAPTATPMINCAIVPTTISESAVTSAAKSRAGVAISANPSHSAVCAQTGVMASPYRVIASGRNAISLAAVVGGPHPHLFAGIVTKLIPRVKLTVPEASGDWQILLSFLLVDLEPDNLVALRLELGLGLRVGLAIGPGPEAHR